MIAENTIRKQIQVGKQQKIITAAHLFFDHTDFKGTKTVDTRRQDTTVLSGINYYLERENWIFREKAQINSSLFFAELLQTLNNIQSTVEQKLEELVLKYVDLLFEKPDFAAYLITDIMSSPNKKLSYHIRNLYERDRFFVSNRGNLIFFKSFPVIISLIRMVLLPLSMIYCLENQELSQFNEFEDLIEQRKKLLPLWIKSALEKL